MSAGQKDNGSFVAKQRQRLRVAACLPPGARVLDGFAGEGRIWRGCWSSFAGACLDKDERKVREAARERAGWACYAGDTERALGGGFMRHVPFDVVDLDAYGSPWPFLWAWLRSERVRAPLTHVFLTDGYMRQASRARACSALFPGAKGRNQDMPPELYLATVRAKVGEWSAPAGVVPSEMDTIAHRYMRLHYLTFATPSGTEGMA